MNASKPIIRMLAAPIYLLRKKAIRAAAPRIIVFTGTSGKTTTRSLLSHALRELGFSVVSPKWRYTNELGVILACLGIESVSLRTFSGWRRIFGSTCPGGSFVCIELGADCYDDIKWFLKRFTPAAVVVTSRTDVAWSRSLADILEDQQLLVASIAAGGVVIEPQDLVQSEGLQQVAPDPQRYFAPATVRVSGRIKAYSFNFYRSLFAPELQALTQTIFYLEAAGQAGDLPEDLFARFRFSAERLQVAQAKNEAVVIADTYKAIPYCTGWFLDTVACMSAKRKVLVLSEMRPVTRDRSDLYAALSGKLAAFDEAYFIGPQWVFDVLAKAYPTLRCIAGMYDYRAVAHEILATTKKGDLICIKGSAFYHLNELRDALIKKPL